MTAPRALVLAAAAATLVLAACSSPAPDPVDPGPSESPSEPTVVSLSELEFPFDGENFAASLVDGKAQLQDWRDTFAADCTAELAGSADSPDCTESMLTGLQKVNGIKTTFDFSYDNADWDSGDYSGLVALADTREGVQVPSASGSEFIDTCYYVPGGDGSGECVATAQTFLDDVDGFLQIMASWEA